MANVPELTVLGSITRESRSSIGYDFSSIETDPDIVGSTGNISYDSYGTGSVYQAFAGAGVTFWKKLSLGAEIIYYFGNIDKVTDMNYSDGSYRSLNIGSELMLRGTTGKFGLQYEQRLGGDISMVVGATYKLGTDMKGYATNFRYADQSTITDTLKFSVDTLARSGVRFGDELGLGISFKGGEKWSAEFNYLRSDWRNSGMDTAPGFAISGDSKFSATVSNSFRAGFEIVPNRNDIRYYLRRCAYRAGVYLMHHSAHGILWSLYILFDSYHSLTLKINVVSVRPGTSSKSIQYTVIGGLVASCR